jgi:histidyl-tRNA synthetase
LRLAVELRDAGIEARVDGRGQKLNRMLPRASSSGARFCVILGDGELERGVVALKDLAAHTQEEPARDRLLPRLCELLGEATR